jgi:GNAT superfamily N-acetyltransferase
MIIPGQSRHLKDLVRLGQAYHAESPYKGHIEFDDIQTLEFLRQAMIMPTVSVAVLDIDGRARGAAIAGIMPFYWNLKRRCHMEFLYIDPEYRGQGHAEALLVYTEQWAKKHECVEITAGDLGLRPRFTERFLREQGYQDPGVMLRKPL